MSYEEVSRCSKCRKYCRNVTAFLFSHVGLCALVVGYSLFGALMFEALESGYEETKRKTILQERENVVTNLWSITEHSDVLSEHNWTTLASETLQHFEAVLVKAVRKEGYDGKEESPLQWTFSGALLYSIIVITTIGYGNVAPKTPWGKVTTVLYAVIGIPLLLLCLSNIGGSMAHSFRFIYWKVCCYFCVRPAKKRHRRTQNKAVYAAFSRTPHRHSTDRCSELGDSPTHCETHRRTTSNASPTISSCRHSPTNIQNYEETSFVQALNMHPYFSPSKDVSQVAVIMNKYALEKDDKVNYFPLHLHKKMGRSLQEAPDVFLTISDSPNFRSSFSSLPDCAKQDRFSWRDSVDSISSDSGDPEDVSVPMWLCFLLVLSYICGGAVLFTFWEDWNFLDSGYFCFVTLTTIGFGDLVPGTAVISDDHQLTLGLCSLYLLFGMALLAMSFNLVQEEVKRSIRCIGRRMGIISDEDDD